MTDFQGKVFLVTGASSGIGRAIARALGDAGAGVAAMARSAARLEELGALFPGADRFLAVPGDVSSDEACRAAVEATREKFGRLDGLIHSAGISMSGKIEDTRLEVYREVMEINYFAMIRLVQATIEPIKEARGHIAAISSIAGFVSYPFGSGYAASKHALQAFMDALRLELSPAGVHVLSVCPGYVRTEIARNARRPDGTPWGETTREIEGGLDPEIVAAKTLHALRTRKRQIFPAGAIETAGRLVKPVAPGLLDAVMARMYAGGRKGG